MVFKKQIDWTLLVCGNLVMISCDLSCCTFFLQKFIVQTVTVGGNIATFTRSVLQCTLQECQHKILGSLNCVKRTPRIKYIDQITLGHKVSTLEVFLSLNEENRASSCKLNTRHISKVFFTPLASWLFQSLSCNVSVSQNTHIRAYKPQLLVSLRFNKINNLN